MTGLEIDFAGEVDVVERGQTFTIGRDGDLRLEDNPYLHRHFLELVADGDLWWVANVGSHLAAHLTDEHGLMRTTLAPGARLPLVFPTTLLTFAAGQTAYELIVRVPTPAYQIQPHRVTTSGGTTITPPSFTVAQLQAILALAEPVLRRAGAGAAQVPTAVEAARRLGWTQTRFNRKIDNVCDKLDRVGVRGLRGDPSSVASNRRLLLVDYAVSTLLVTREDLPLLEQSEEDE